MTSFDTYEKAKVDALLADKLGTSDTAASAASLTDAGLTAVFASTACSQTIDGTAVTSATDIVSRAVATVDGSNGTAESPFEVSVTFSAAVGSALRYCELLVTGVAEDAAVTVKLPSGTYEFADGADATEAGDNHFIFAEYTSGCWFVSRVTRTAQTIS